MKTLIINTSDISGGAAIACNRLFQGLRKSGGVDVGMLVKNKAGDDYGVEVEKRVLYKIVGQGNSVFEESVTKMLKTENRIIHSPAIFSSLNLGKVKEINPDIVHLHWVCGGFVSIKDIRDIQKPIVWTLHDMWAFCGAEHYAKGTIRYKEGYTKENRPDYESGPDINKWTWQRKMRAWKDVNMTIVAPSKWMAKCARESKILSGRRIEVIPNGIDINIFKPLDKEFSRKSLNLPQNKKLLLFGAMGATKDPRKGFPFAQEALQKIAKEKQYQDVELVVFGASAPQEQENLGFKMHYLGRMHDEASLALAYSSADAFVVPSLEDNLPNTIMESLSCGTPCVTFDTGGIPDMIDHRENGYLAEYKDSGDLAKGIEWILNSDRYDELCENARKKVVENFDSRIIAKKYKKLYEEVLKY